VFLVGYFITYLCLENIKIPSFSYILNFFKGLKSFKDFKNKTKALSNTTEVDDAFEILVEGYLLKIDKVLGAKSAHFGKVG
jgi:hypothetical protein